MYEIFGSRRRQQQRRNIIGKEAVGVHAAFYYVILQLLKNETWMGIFLSSPLFSTKHHHNHHYRDYDIYRTQQYNDITRYHDEEQ